MRQKRFGPCSRACEVCMVTTNSFIISPSSQFCSIKLHSKVFCSLLLLALQINILSMSSWPKLAAVVLFLILSPKSRLVFGDRNTVYDPCGNADPVAAGDGFSFAIAFGDSVTSWNDSSPCYPSTLQVLLRSSSPCVFRSFS